MEELSRTTLAVRYVLDDYLQLKGGYFTYNPGETGEPDFDNNLTKYRWWRDFKILLLYTSDCFIVPHMKQRLTCIVLIVSVLFASLVQAAELNSLKADSNSSQQAVQLEQPDNNQVAIAQLSACQHCCCLHAAGLPQLTAPTFPAAQSVYSIPVQPGMVSITLNPLLKPPSRV